MQTRPSLSSIAFIWRKFYIDSIVGSQADLTSRANVQLDSIPTPITDLTRAGESRLSSQPAYQHDLSLRDPYSQPLSRDDSLVGPTGTDSQVGPGSKLMTRALHAATSILLPKIAPGDKLYQFASDYGTHTWLCQTYLLISTYTLLYQSVPGHVNHVVLVSSLTYKYSHSGSR